MDDVVCGIIILCLKLRYTDKIYKCNEILRNRVKWRSKKFLYEFPSKIVCGMEFIAAIVISKLTDAIGIALTYII